MKPFEELVLPGMAFGAAFKIAHAKAMSSRRILDVAMVHAGGRQGCVEEDGVMVVDHGVVNAVDKENGRTIGGDMPLERK